MRPTRLFTLVFACLLSLLAGLIARADTLDLTIDFAAFTGGFAPAPLAGQLDSDTWSINGLSDGDLPFGGTAESGDFARGTSPGGVGTGGLYAFDSGGNTLLGVQPTGTDFTPGSFTLRLRNETGASLDGVTVSYEIYFWNDQDRGSTLNLAYGSDGESFSPLPAVDFTTPTAADPAPVWQTAGRSTVVPLTVPDGGLLFLRWTSNDAGGSGSRDEFGLDNIAVTGLSPTAVTLSSKAAARGNARYSGRWGAATLALALLTGLVLQQRRSYRSTTPLDPHRCAMIGRDDNASHRAQRA